MHKRNIVWLGLSIIVLLILPDALGLFFEYFKGISLTAYLSYMGSVIGAGAVLLGVMITIWRQEIENNKSQITRCEEKKTMLRLANIPSLSYIVEDTDGTLPDVLIALENDDEENAYNYYFGMINVKNVGKNPAYAVTIKLLFNGKEYPWNRMEEMPIIAPEESKSFPYAFYLIDAEYAIEANAEGKTYETDFICSFRDVFGNQYEQRGRLVLEQIIVLGGSTKDYDYYYSITDVEVPKATCLI